MGHRKYHDAHPITPEPSVTITQTERNHYMFNGSIVALVTPFTDQDRVDRAALDALVDFHVEQGTDGLVVAGTTGESATLGKGEFDELLTIVLRRANGPHPGAGRHRQRMPPRSRCARPAWPASWAPMACSSSPLTTCAPPRPVCGPITPPWPTPPWSRSCCTTCPSRTAVDMLPETVEALAGHARIVGIKEAAGGQGRIEELRARCGPEFAVLSGDDRGSLGAMKSGADGVISVAANVVPGPMHQLCVEAAEHNWPPQTALDERLQPLFDALSLETNPIPVKWALFRNEPHQAPESACP
jgi:4-hydroxy-tetrahydrodipicolinate synthase